MRRSLFFTGARARVLACAITVAGAWVVSGCQSEPVRQAATVRPAVLVLENLGNCEWRVTATPVGRAERSVHVPVGATIRFEVPAGSCEIRQEALAGVDRSEAARQFSMTLAAGEVYHWRLVTLASVRDEIRR